MASCVECGAENEVDARFCSSCGQPTSGFSEFATVASPQKVSVGPAPSPVYAASGVYGSATLAQPAVSRFAPGTVLDARYRIVALLGRGGMGEVYRADDLKLGHAVALKFLPPSLERDIGLLDRFHAEVRNARQISHPNVCRVYDIGEIDGRHYFTMEYIDGEDLASLLRRIGRLPHDKAVELGHQLCAGLAAAHDNGLLHRDLKPANIMIDGRGRARITDFGLALRADEAGAVREFAGTPAYMAPEQLSGGAASVRSDIYALGLILYEMFTGKRPFEGESRADWTRLHVEHTPRIPSTVTDVSPAVERAILRCLSKDPTMRPASALQVSAALPGGDPLAAAMAAGETPSPEMVAAAGKETGITVKGAVALFAAVLVLLALLMPLARRSMLLAVAPMPKSPDVLADRAQTIIEKLGYSASAGDRYGWTRPDAAYMRYRAEHERAPARVRDLATAWPGAYRFTYRQSPGPMTPINDSGEVTGNDPAMDTPGMIALALNGNGQLVSFRAVPPATLPADTNAGPADWPSLFREAGLNIADFKPVNATAVPPNAFDARASWEGKQGGYDLTVDAASLAGKPVFFDIRAPWSAPRGETGNSLATRPDLVSMLVSVLFLFVLPAVGLVMARRNIRSGRGDTVGAARLAIFVIVMFGGRQLLAMHYSEPRGVLMHVTVTIGLSLFVGGVMWAGYMALEPMVRRQSPHLAISWARLISGRFTDPLVGRDVLIGVAVALLVCMCDRVPRALPWWWNVRGLHPELPLTDAIGGTGPYLGLFLNGAWNAVFIALMFLFIVTLGTALFRRKWAGALTLFAILASLDALQMSNPAVQILPVVLGGTLLVFTLVRVGPVALATVMATQQLVSNMPLVVDPGTWYVTRAVVTVGIILALAVFGLKTSLAGRPVLAALTREAERERSAAAV